MTLTEVLLGVNGSGILFLSFKAMFEYFKYKNSYKEPPVSVNIETPKMASTSGKKICDFHMELYTIVLNMKHALEDFKEQAEKARKEINDVSNSNIIIQEKLDTIREYFHIRSGTL